LTKTRKIIIMYDRGGKIMPAAKKPAAKKTTAKKTTTKKTAKKK